MIKSIITICLLMFGGISMAQQDVMLTQFMYNKLSINPAYAGHDDYTNLNLTYRDQWNGLPGAPNTQLASVNLPLIRKSVGVGFDLQRQSIGISNKTSLSLKYAYKFFFEKSNLSLGMSVTGKRYAFDFTDDRLIAIQGLNIDPSIPDQAVSSFLMNIGLGAYLSGDNYYVSLSTPGLLNSDIDFDENDSDSEEVSHVYLMGGATFPVADRIDFTPQILFKYAANTPFDIDLNLGLTLDEKYTAALAYRFGGATGDVGESIDVLLGLQLTEKLLLGFSLDFTLSKLRTYDNGSIELVVGYAFRDGKMGGARMINPRYF